MIKYNRVSSFGLWKMNFWCNVFRKNQLFFKRYRLLSRGGAQLTIKLPSTVEDYSDDEEEDDEDDQRPFTREELKLKAIRGIQKKQEKSKKAGRRN